MSLPSRALPLLFKPADRLKVLEIGCFTGYSALAWYESTKQVNAEIITLELDPKMIAASRRTFDKYGLNDRVRMIEGDALQSLKKLTGTFDLIFVDANKDGYEAYVKSILDQKLLAPAGLIMADNSKVTLIISYVSSKADHFPTKSSLAG